MVKNKIVSTGSLYDFVVTLRDLRGSNAKKAAIQNMRKEPAGSDSLDWLYNAVYDYNKMYHVVALSINPQTKIKYPDDTTTVETLQNVLLWPLLDKTFDKPRLQASEIASQFGPKTQELIKLILAKDLKAGFLDASYNKLVGEEICPQFNVQLATAGGKDFNEMFSAIVDMLKTNGQILISGKYDGIRVICYPNGTMRTRNGHDISDNFPEISNALRNFSKLLHMEGDNEVILDGELYDPIGAASNKVMTQAFRKTNVNTSGVMKLMAFDCIDYNEWQEHKCTEPLSERLNKLEDISKRYDYLFGEKGLFHAVPHVYATTESGIRKAFEFFKLNKLEGLMAKDPTSFYEWKRTKSWLKLKGKESQTLKVVDFIEGNKGTKYVGTLGALLLEDGSKCGSGLTDKDRNEIWKNKKKYLGALVDVTFDCRLESDKGLMRFPSFQGFRWDLVK